MNFIRGVNVDFNKRVLQRPGPEEEAAIVFGDGRNGNVFKLVKDVFLSFFDVNELCDVNHGYRILLGSNIASNILAPM